MAAENEKPWYEFSENSNLGGMMIGFVAVVILCYGVIGGLAAGGWFWLEFKVWTRSLTTFWTETVEAVYVIGGSCFGSIRSFHMAVLAFVILTGMATWGIAAKVKKS